MSTHSTRIEEDEKNKEEEARKARGNKAEKAWGEKREKERSEVERIAQGQSGADALKKLTDLAPTDKEMEETKTGGVLEGRRGA